MSSAILYLAIIAIWACVLIPRWLRRSSSHGAATAPPADVAAGDPVPDDGRPRVADERLDSPGEAEARPEEPAEDQPPQEPLTPEESRQRMLAARRRLLGMVIALEAAAIALAVFGLAALWVVIPPSAMLTGYLLLLREAAHADAEREQREAEAAHARQRARARAAVARHTAPGAPARGAAATASAAEYEDAGPGRDFAPGLAGKYTTSNAEVTEPVEQADSYNEYWENRLRAVGD